MRISAWVIAATISMSWLASAQTAATAPRAKAVAATGDSYIGVNVQEIDSERAKALKLREEAGVEVTRVATDSPADKAGLKVGDAIVQYNGQRVEGMEQFQRLIHETPPGREVKLEVFRGGSPQTLTAKVGSKHGSNVFAFAAPAISPKTYEFRMPDMPRSFMSWQSSLLGVEAESLDGQLAQYFGVKEGVLIRSITSGSAADKAGMKAGDVIIRVDDSKVTTPSDVSTRLRALHGKQVSIVVMRDRKEVPLTVALDEDRRAEWFLQQNLQGTFEDLSSQLEKLRGTKI